MRWSVLDTVLLTVISFHLIQAPFTKVEESFNIQAIHDILTYSVFDISQYDHLKFPGVVPRTFVGAVIIAMLSRPYLYLSSLIQTSRPTSMDVQLVVRGIVGLTNGLSFIYLKNCLQDMFDEITKKKKEENEDKDIYIYDSVGTWFLLFLIGSFHLMFYSTRTLPNFVMTLPLTNVALGWVLLGRYNAAIFLSALVAIVFRLEVSALSAGIALFSVIFKKISLFDAIKFGIFGLGLGSAISITVDSYFWQEWCLPEVDGFLFNVVAGYASKWGVEPVTAYFTHYLRMMFMPPTVLLLNYFGYKLAPAKLKIVSLASLFHIIVLSFQPHKEWRFIIYAVPSIMLLGATGAAHLWENMKVKKITNVLCLAILPLSIMTSFFISMAFLYISRMNYPGGEALTSFNDMIVEKNITNATIHVSIPPCMTGVTLFGELNHDVYGINYDKTENTTLLQEMWPSFDFLITHEPTASQLPFENKTTNHWELVNTTKMFTGFDPTYIKNFVFQERVNVLSLLKQIIFDKTPTVFLKELTTNSIVKSDVFFTYKRIKQDEKTD
ncbi:dolichyl-P-Man:Man(7)GlcNAc(2)-PP-dolichol alpha-1,6-mannosyltransferase [Saccharomyces cerevisiae]|nr:Alg12p [Saccharomyces cerevisiae YJM1388]CAI4737874.1 ALH_1c_G0047080.mRNA.1.CDS.1 [Saccharomyces cerevisiae]CAI4774466.1 ALH_1b_G0047330.mRNA.1.CDS.1 [Saccharomyces cerevisiae]CAI5307286.1 AKR_HP2_G0044260.mRNA.1.CDS.1 [Saccharomyces cerevisiae]CAI6666822.1 AKR_HP2_G0044260.mRNA.1.CDS.1 [Saccharomyces cerevisiae]